MAQNDQSIPPQQVPSRALVTGGAGFIGSHLVELLLNQGVGVTVIDNLSTGRIENLSKVIDEIEFIEADVDQGLAQIDDRKGFDEVYHLAAAVGVDLVLKDPIKSIKTNIEQTDAVFEYALNHGLPPTLIASSSEVYGKPDSIVFSEEDDLHFGPTTITRWSYAHAKAIDEHLALGYWQQHKLPTVICRFFNTVGPRQIGRYGMVLPRFVQAALAGEPLKVFGDGTQSRCFCDGRDVIEALPKMVRSPACYGRVFNVGSDHPISINELARTVITTLNSKSTIERIAYSDAYPAGFEDLRHRKPDLDRIKEAVGFEPMFTLTQTIQDLANELSSSGVVSSQGGER
ncbi:MAG: NAD-dependent epimerase/dehydratase family protein [Phycisphaerales bacterium]|nr:NAD-dependent epimerase/dehydratase family protein [Phycisphaerales bacterium]